MSMAAVRVFIGSTLVTISFDLASRDYIFDRNAFYVLFQKFSVSSVFIARDYLRSNAQNRYPFHHLRAGSRALFPNEKH